MGATLFAALALTAGTLAYGVAAAQPQNCKLIRIDEWAVLPNIATPVIEGIINGHRVGVLIDTGMAAKEGALLERALARRLGVFRIPDPNRTAGGVGGESLMEIGHIGEIQIGQMRRRDWSVLVGGEDHGQAGFFIIGSAFFQNHEVEFDLSRQRVRLFKSEGCRDVSLAYWTRSASEAPMQMDKWVRVQVLLNGKPVAAVLDSGATTTVIDTSVLVRIGAESQLRTAAPGTCLRGFGKQEVRSQIGEFDSFVLG
ncbi:MAG TPA: pepsin/retropepsin-like aspartic protease family protein, partial [Burkholderiales bacterium]|nr:pepsin/retropepsin-like aspartic protease family protein [Burkholderiales bacterium]